MRHPFNLEHFHPWLVQRAKVNNINRATTDQKVSDFLDLDYMGAAEFEFGAIPEALVQYANCYQNMPIKTGSVQIDRNGTQMELHYVCLESQWAEVREWLSRRGTMEPHLKESLYLGMQYTNINFWFDIEHFFAFSTSGKAIKAFQDAVKISAKIILENRQEGATKKEESLTKMDTRRQARLDLKSAYEAHVERLNKLLEDPRLDSSKRYKIDMILRDTRNSMLNTNETTWKAVVRAAEKVK